MDEKELAASFQELPEIQRQEFEKNETIKGLLTQTDEKTVSIRIGTVDVKILAAPPRKLRHALLTYQRLCQQMEPADKENVSLTELDAMEAKLQEVESSLYPMLTQMVISPAELKDPKVWQYLDEQEGLAMTAYLLIMQKMNEKGEDIKNSQKATKGK